MRAEASQHRLEVLQALINLSSDVDLVAQDLQGIPWDSDEELLVFRAGHVVNVLDRFLLGELTELDIEKWANLIEGREDLGFEAESKLKLEQWIFQAANPEVMGSLSLRWAKGWVARFTR